MLEVSFGGGGSQPEAHPNMAFIADGHRVEVPLGPLEIAMSGIAGTWAEIARDARSPLLVRSGGQLRKLSMTLDVAYPSGDPVAQVLADLQALPTAKVVSISYDESLSGILWNCTAMSTRSVERRSGDNEITQAVVDVELTETSTADLDLGPVAGPKSITEPDSPTGTTPSDSIWTPQGPTSRAATYPAEPDWRNYADTVTWVVWNSDETIQSFARRVTGKADDWRKIAELNDLAAILVRAPSHAAMKLKVPTVLIGRESRAQIPLPVTRAPGGGGGSW